MTKLSTPDLEQKIQNGLLISSGLCFFEEIMLGKFKSPEPKDVENRLIEILNEQAKSLLTNPSPNKNNTEK